MCFRKEVFLRRVSIKTTLQSGSRIASGIPGKPPPEPMSAISLCEIFMWLVMSMESIKCLIAISRGSTMRVRLVERFHSSSSSI